MAAVLKADYLKKYLSTDEKKKKKKKPRSEQKSRLRIHDEDIDLSKLLPRGSDDDFDTDKPTVAAVIDERPKDVQQLEKFRQDKRWKVLDDDPQGTDGKLGEIVFSRVRKRYDSSSSDTSPPRKSRKDEAHQRTKQRQAARHDSDSDLSPARPGISSRHNQKKQTNAAKSDSDLSPERNNHQRQRTGNTGRDRHDSESDLSPPRNIASQDKLDNANGSDSDLSPPRTKTRKDSRQSDSDLSPPRSKNSNKSRKDRDSDLSPPRSSRRDHPKERVQKTLSGSKAGLSTAVDVKKELKERRIREVEMFKNMDEGISGRKAKTVVRKVRKSSREREEEVEKAKKKEKVDEQYQKWGKGLAQQEQARKEVEVMVHEMSKPLARMKDDADLDAMLRDRERTDEVDPMADMLTKKKSGSKQLNMPKYKGPEPPANRFNIWPGYRWDGVDRSNGFEKKFLMQKANKKAVDEIAYKWSTEDM